MHSAIGPASAETAAFLASFATFAQEGLMSPKLVFHTYKNHIVSSTAFLHRQWQRYESYGVPLNYKATGATVLGHDHGIAEPLNKDRDGSKEQRTVGLITPELERRGMGCDDLVVVRSGTLATGLYAELDPDKPNDIAVVQADLHNTWDGYWYGEEFGYWQMATNAQSIRREDENLDQEHLSLKQHQDKVNHVLGTFFARDMAIIDADRLPDTGECVYNHIGKIYLARYMTETPSSLAPLVGIPAAQLA